MFEFKLPDLGEGVAEGELLAWHVAAGDGVSEDDVLAEVETDKAAVDVPSPVDGVVQELRHEEGDIIRVGEVLVTIDDEGDVAEAEAADAEAQAAETGDDEAAQATATDEETATAETAVTGEATQRAEGGRVFAPPNVRRLARELGVDVTTVPGSGPSGRVTEADVRTAAEEADEAEGDEESGAEDDGKQLKSAVRRVGGDGADERDDEGDGPQSAARGIDEDESDATGTAGDGHTGEPAVKSAVKKVGAGGEAARGQTLATPATRKAARELGVDIDSVPTDETRDGEAYVTEEAVRSYAEQQQGAQAESAAQATETAETTATTDGTVEATGEAEGTVVDAPRPTRREPYRGVRRTIGEQMQRSRREIPHATHHDLAEVSALVDARERLEPRAEKRGVKLTYLPFVLKSVAAALRDHPVLNTELDEDAEEIIYKEYYDVGIATATDAGLMVPVVRNVDDKRILEVAAEVNDLVERARDRSIERSEMQGGTFTVTNFGAIGGEFANPVINAPQTAILGIGSLKERAVADDGEAVVRQTLPLSLAIDHRVVDGADAARFVNTVKEYLSDPTLLLLE